MSDCAMAYSPKAVANFILTQAFREGIPISPMKLQKLLYYTQGWHLAFTDTPIFNEQIECWPYGPVVSSVFHHFKLFGKDPIDRKATDVRPRKVDGRRVFRTVIPVLPDDLPSESREVLDAVWDSYKNLTAIKLSNMTHAADGPWREIYDRYSGSPPTGTDIPMELIARYFKAQLEEES
ncbi:MAG: SocA family protein [Planctomycetaceae bacterium]|jgi:uncharacterized phage-associated protein|nr:SocA family protein [Planctomycetaceae bacterium]